MNITIGKRISQAYPIYLTRKLKAVPDHCVYALCPSVADLGPFYVGTSTQPEKRYRRYVNAAKKPANQSHESLVKIDTFKKYLSYSETGTILTPVMVLIDSVAIDAIPNDVERQYRDAFTQV